MSSGWQLSDGEGEVLWEQTQEKIKAAGSVAQVDNIVVVTRTRPFNKREKDLNTTNCIEMKSEDPNNSQVWITDPSARSASVEPSIFRFDYCFDSFDPTASNYVGQRTVFQSVGLDILAKAWSGYNACLFAYGQTGSGKSSKTYSVMGYGEDKGVIPRICEALFYFVERFSDGGSNESFKVDASYLEVYNEQISDLLHPPPREEDFVPLKPKERIAIETKLKKLLKASVELKGHTERTASAFECDLLRAKLDPLEAKKQRDFLLPKVREDPGKGVCVDNLKHFAVSSFADCEKLLEEGLANRTMGSTAMNASSSRSHCVFTLQLQKLSAGAEKATLASSKITLIDLAGSEKTETAKTEGQGLVEGININKSLSCLGQCIAGLAKAAASKDAAEAKKTDEQRDLEKKEKEDKAQASAEKAAAKWKKKRSMSGEDGGEVSGSGKYGVKTGAPVKRIDRSDTDFIPFRESVLTWILRDSLVGNSKTVMLAALSPAGANYQETLSTLRFAAQAKQLKTKAIVNEDPVQKLVAELRAEIESLKVQVVVAGGVGGGSVGGSIGGSAGGGVGGAGSKAQVQQQQPASLSLLADKEAEVAALVAAQIAAKEVEWAERERNMNNLSLALRQEREDHQQQQATDSSFSSFPFSTTAAAAVQTRRRKKVTSLVIDGASASCLAGAPYLTMLSSDLSSSRTLRIAVDPSGHTKLRIGGPGAATPQDLELDGVGIALETCVVWADKEGGGGAGEGGLSPSSPLKRSSSTSLSSTSSPSTSSFGAGGLGLGSGGVFRIAAGSSAAIVYVNGVKLTYSRPKKLIDWEAHANGSDSMTHAHEREGSVLLRPHDRIALGHCAHVLVVVDPNQNQNNISGDVNNKNAAETKTTKKKTSVAIATFDSCVHEVMLQRAHGEREYKKRLAAFVVAKLRLPRTRALFEEQLLHCVHGVREVTALLKEELGCFVKYSIRGGGQIEDADRLYSLRLEDALPHHNVKLTVTLRGEPSTLMLVRATLVSLAERNREHRATAAKAAREKKRASKKRLAKRLEWKAKLLEAKKTKQGDLQDNSLAPSLKQGDAESDEKAVAVSSLLLSSLPVEAAIDDNQAAAVVATVADGRDADVAAKEKEIEEEAAEALRAAQESSSDDEEEEFNDGATHSSWSSALVLFEVTAEEFMDVADHLKMAFQHELKRSARALNAFTAKPQSSNSSSSIRGNKASNAAASRKVRVAGSAKLSTNDAAVKGGAESGAGANTALPRGRFPSSSPSSALLPSSFSTRGGAAAGVAGEVVVVEGGGATDGGPARNTRPRPSSPRAKKKRPGSMTSYLTAAATAMKMPREQQQQQQQQQQHALDESTELADASVAAQVVVGKNDRSGDAHRIEGRSPPPPPLPSLSNSGTSKRTSSKAVVIAAAAAAAAAAEAEDNSSNSTTDSNNNNVENSKHATKHPLENLRGNGGDSDRYQDRHNGHNNEDDNEDDDGEAGDEASNASVHELIDRAFESCALPDKRNPDRLYLNHRVGFTGALFSLGFGLHALSSQSLSSSSSEPPPPLPPLEGEGEGERAEGGEAAPAPAPRAEGGGGGLLGSGGGDPVLEWDIGFALDCVLVGNGLVEQGSTVNHAASAAATTGEGTVAGVRVHRSDFVAALAVFLRKRALTALRGPWMPFEPDEATATLFCTGLLPVPPSPSSPSTLSPISRGGGVDRSYSLAIVTTTKASLSSSLSPSSFSPPSPSASAGGSSSSSALILSLTRELDELHLGLSKAVRGADWAQAAELEAQTRSAREALAAAEGEHRARAAEREAAWAASAQQQQHQQQQRRKRRGWLGGGREEQQGVKGSSSSSSSSSGRRQATPSQEGEGGGGGHDSKTGHDSSSSKSSSSHRSSRTSKILSWRHSHVVNEVDHHHPHHHAAAAAAANQPASSKSLLGLRLFASSPHPPASSSPPSPPSSASSIVETSEIENNDTTPGTQVNDDGKRSSGGGGGGNGGRLQRRLAKNKNGGGGQGEVVGRATVAPLAIAMEEEEAAAMLTRALSMGEDDEDDDENEGGDHVGAGNGKDANGRNRRRNSDNLLSDDGSDDGDDDGLLTASAASSLLDPLLLISDITAGVFSPSSEAKMAPSNGEGGHDKVLNHEKKKRPPAPASTKKEEGKKKKQLEAGSNDKKASELDLELVASRPGTDGGPLTDPQVATARSSGL